MTASVDVAAVARRLTKPQRWVLAEAAAGHLVRDELSYRRTPYLTCRYMDCRISENTPRQSTVSKLWLDLELIELGESVRRERSYVVTDLGRAVLDHLAEQERAKRRDNDHRWS